VPRSAVEMMRDRFFGFTDKLKNRRDVQVWWVFWVILAIVWFVMFGTGIRISAITAQFPTMDSVMVDVNNLTFPHFCIHAFSPSAKFSVPANSKSGAFCRQEYFDGPTAGTYKVLPVKSYQTGCPAEPPNRHASQCLCFNNYDYTQIGTDAPLIGVFNAMAPIICEFNVNNGSALLWICDPNADGSCGDRYSNPFGSNARALSTGMRTFVSLDPIFVHNENFTKNSTIYQTHVSPVFIQNATVGDPNMVLGMNFESYKVFHYFPRNEFDSFRFIIFMSMMTFFLMWVHKMAFLIVKIAFFRTTLIEAGWGPKSAKSGTGYYSNQF